MTLESKRHSIAKLNQFQLAGRFRIVAAVCIACVAFLPHATAGK
jgi:hypothetical protein